MYWGRKERERMKGCKLKRSEGVRNNWRGIMEECKMARLWFLLAWGWLVGLVVSFYNPDDLENF
jgi:hypothetical protein